MQTLLISGILLLTIYHSCFVASTLYPKFRIINGIETSIDRAPYIVQLRTKAGRTFCAGSLIAPQYVLTAAHCFNEYFFRQVIVVAGANTRTDRGVLQSGISSIDIHHEYNAISMHTDVAIAKLQKPMMGENIGIIRLCQEPLNVGDVVKIFGWGQTSKGELTSPTLQTGQVSVITREECTNEFGRFAEKNVFCATGNGRVSFYLGDSGGPAVFKNQLCGINSYTFGLGKDTGFTDVYALRQYIEEALQDKHVLDWDY